jgi:hypothetical protein
MRRFHYALIAGAAFFASASAQATITISAVPGNDPYAGPTPTYDFNGGGATGGAPVSGGLVTNTSVGSVSAQPFGSTDYFWTVGPTDGTPGTMNLVSFGDIFNISFIWGSVDTYNTLEVLGAGGAILATFTGANVALPPNGDQVDPTKNPLVTLFFDGGDEALVEGLRLTSTQNAFETDNYAINAVPEPGTWALMLLGFGALGMTMRRRRRSASVLAQAV